MTDFDTRLTARLERLDAAIPAPAIRQIPAAASVTTDAGRRPRPLPRLVPLLAAAALLIGGGVVTAERLLYPDNPEPELEAALANVFAAGGCVRPGDARVAIRELLDGSGHASWTIREHAGVQGTACTGGALFVETHEVFLMPALGLDASGALEAAKAELLATCFNRDEALAFYTSVLASAGVTDFEVRADPWGPRGYPIDQADEYNAHVAAGCWVSAGGMTMTEDGHRTFHLWGNWP